MICYHRKLVRYSTIFTLLMLSLAFAQTSTLFGKVTAADCPWDPRMGMPCLITPVAGCTVTIYTNIDKPILLDEPTVSIYPPPGGLTVVTDARGEFTFKLKSALPKGTKILINANAKGYEWYSSNETINGLPIDTVFISLTPARSPASGVVSAIIGTAWTSKCPPAGAEGIMPCVLEPVANCTLTFYITASYSADLPPASGAEPGFVSPSYAPLQTITDAKGEYRLTLDPALEAGTEISVYAQKSGYLPSRNVMILGGDSIAQLDVYLEEGALPPPPVLCGYASVSGTVSYSDPNSMLTVMTPVRNCTVYVYAAVVTDWKYYEVGGDDSTLIVGSVPSAGYDTPVSNIALDPVTSYYMAVTDSVGRYSIDSIQIWCDDPTVKQASFIVSAYKLGFGSAEVASILEAGKDHTVDLYLQPEPPAPEPVGKAKLSGFVRRRNCPATANDVSNCLLDPVAQCTVVVSAAYVPYLLAVRTDAYVPPVIEKTYVAVTDNRGRYTIEEIDLFSDNYEVIVMAQKYGLFGSTVVMLQANQTTEADVILDELSYVLVETNGGVDTVRTAEAAFYVQKKEEESLMPVRRPEPEQSALASERGSIAFIDKQVRFSLSEAQVVTVAAYGADGRRTATLAEQWPLAVGTHTLSLPKFSEGRPMLIVIKGSRGFSAATVIPGALQ